MPKNKVNPLKNKLKAFHPNSRRAVQLIRKSHRIDKVDRLKKQKLKRQSVQVSKLMWFRDAIDATKSSYTYAEVLELIERYLHRLDESLDEITDIQSGKVHTATHYRHQYASREDKIRETIVRERQMFNSSGIEIPDFTSVKCLKTFLDWHGEVDLLPRLKMKTFRGTITS